MKKTSTFIVPKIPKNIDAVMNKAMDDPSLATVLRKVFQEIEHLAYRKRAIQEKENDNAG